MRNQWRGEEEGGNHEGMGKICTDWWRDKELTDKTDTVFDAWK